MSDTKVKGEQTNEKDVKKIIDTVDHTWYFMCCCRDCRSDSGKPYGQPCRASGDDFCLRVQEQETSR